MKSRLCRIEKSQLVEHHRKLRVRGLPPLPRWRVATLMYSGRKTAALSYLPRLLSDSHDYLLPPIDYLTVSHDYLLPLTTICCLPRLTCCFSRLPAPSQDYLPPLRTTCCQPLVSRCACLEKGLRHLALDCFYGVLIAQKAR